MFGMSFFPLLAKALYIKDQNSSFDNCTEIQYIKQVLY